MSEEAHGVRLDRVETEVSTIRTEMGGIKNKMTGLEAGMRGLGDVLQRIEASVSNAQQQWQDDKQASRINPIALSTVLVSVISVLIGGAWLVSGGLATNSTRLEEQDKSMARMISLRDREFDIIERRLDRMEDRRGVPPAPAP